jgi:hypothetical protein
MLFYLLPFLFACIGISDANVIPRSQYIKGFDLSAPQYHLNHDFWICTRNAGYQKVIIRGFMVLSLFNLQRSRGLMSV